MTVAPLSINFVLQEAREGQRFHAQNKAPYTAGMLGDCIAAIEQLQKQIAEKPALTDPLSSGHGVGSEQLVKALRDLYDFCAKDNEVRLDSRLMRQAHAALQTSSPALQGSEELGNATLADPISSARRLSSEGREPDFCYDPDDWEFTCEWPDRENIADEASIQPDEVKRFCTLLRGPDKFCVVVHNEHVWFDNEADARAAAGLPAEDLFAPAARNSAAAPVASDEANKLAFPNPPSNSGSAE